MSNHPPLAASIFSLPETPSGRTAKATRGDAPHRRRQPVVIGHHTDVRPRLIHVNLACRQHIEDSLSPHGRGARALTMGGGTKPWSASRHPDTTTANEFMISQRRIRVSDRAHRVTGVYGSNVVRSDTALGEAGVVDAGTSDLTRYVLDGSAYEHLEDRLTYLLHPAVRSA